MAAEKEKLRIDKYLWSIRLFKQGAKLVTLVVKAKSNTTETRSNRQELLQLETNMK
jgi:hypothetical protein